MTEPLITFFMIVTDRDCVIADYAIRSYAKIRDIPFKLVVYSNWVRSDLRACYFRRWRRYRYVEIWDDPAKTDDRKPQDRSLYGPFELCYPIWDRELKKLTQTRYHATVDADFEIFDPLFVSVMIDRLEREPKLIAVSTDYNPHLPEYYDSYSDELISLNERWHTHFVIYKREALKCPVSHMYHVELQAGGVARSVWDDGGYFQKALREQCGYDILVLPPSYQRSFIHYGAFVQNRHVDESNVALYRFVQILATKGLFRRGDRVSRRIGRFLDRHLFRHADRATFVPGWARPAPQRYRGHPDVAAAVDHPERSESAAARRTE